MSGSLTRGGRKGSRHSRCMRNPKFHVSGKRPMLGPVSVIQGNYDKCERRVIVNQFGVGKLWGQKLGIQTYSLLFGIINTIHYMVFCRQKYPRKTFHGQNQKKINTRLYLNRLESIMRALSDALPTGHREILQKPVLSFKGNDFKKNGQFEGDIIFCHIYPYRSP